MKIKNRKGISPLGVTVSAAILLILLVVVVGMFSTLSAKEFTWFNLNIEEQTYDCDDDDAVGAKDRCPCDPAITEKAKDQKCGTPSAIATKNCPSLCKK